MKAVIFIPAFNEAPRIKEVIRIAKESRRATEVIVIDDGSTDGTREVAKNTCRVIRYAVNRGKLKAIRDAIGMVQADIYITIDADIAGFRYQDVDNLIQPFCDDPSLMMTVGRCNFQGTTSMDNMGLGSIHTIKQNVSGQRGYRPAVLKKTFEIADGIEAKYPNIKFRYMLEHCSCGAMISLAGKVKEVPFGYNITNPSKDSKWGDGKHGLYYREEKRILDMEIYGRQKEKLAIVMASYDRPNNLKNTLASLASQKYRNFDLYIWNNKLEFKALLENTIKQTNAPYPIYVEHSQNNLGGFARFIVCKNIATKYAYAVFIDDDIALGPDTLYTLAGEAYPETISSAWAFRFVCGMNYWRRSDLKPGEKAHYCGTGEAVVDISLFKDKGFFEAPKEFYVGMDDLWMSYYAHHIMKWSLFKSRAAIKFIPDGKDLSARLGKAKEKALQYLRNTKKWDV